MFKSEIEKEREEAILKTYIEDDRGDRERKRKRGVTFGFTTACNRA